MKIKFLSLFFYVFTIPSFAQLTSGLLLSGGTGRIAAAPKENSPFQQAIDRGWDTKTDYKYNATIGYRFSYQTNNPRFFFNYDALLSLNGLNISYRRRLGSTFVSNETETGNQPGGSGSELSFASFSVGVSTNYYIYKKLHAGLGIMPGCYFWNSSQSGINTSGMFDVSLTGNIGYRFKYFDIAFTYKHSLMNLDIQPENFKKFKLNDWQLQLFIPF
jgi:hypothetical protein